MISKDNFWSSVLAAGGIGELSTGDAVFDRRARCVWRVLESTLVAAQDVAQVECWEDVLELVPGAGLPLVERKAAVLRVLCEELPFTVALLPGRLRQLLGEGNFTVTQGDDGVRVALGLDVSYELVGEVKKLLGCVLPRSVVTEAEWADGMPIDYARLEYIETVNTDDSQFIDTGIMATNETSCKIRIAHLEKKTGHVVFAYSTLNKPMIAMMVNSPSGAYPVFQYGNQATGFSDYKKVLVEGKWYSVENKKNEFFIDGNFIKSLEEEEFETSLPIYLFVGNSNKPVGRGLVRCSEFEVWEGETKVAHFIPALLRETKTPCMFDLISKQPKWNLGAGDFTYPGHEMEQTTYSLRDRKYGKWTENGICRLNCVPEGYSSKAEYAAERGFKVLIETPVPGEGYWAPVWHDREDCIELEWVECESPAEAAEGEVTEN